MKYEYGELYRGNNAYYKINDEPIPNHNIKIYNLITALNTLSELGWEVVLQSQDGKYLMRRKL